MINELIEKFEDIFKPPSDEEAKEREKRWLERELKEKFDKSLLKDNGDGTFDYNGDLDFYDMGLTSLLDLPYKLRRVRGNFYCTYNKLTTLEGAPEKVSGNFDCSFNKVTTLEGAPEYVGGHFSCSYNKLTALEGAPREVGRDFSCEGNQLTTLEGAPEKVGRNFYYHSNPVSVKELKKTVDRDYLK